MILSVHFIAGAALSRVIPEPALLAPAAMALHLALDILPHWEYDFMQTPKKRAAVKIAIDVALGALFVAFVLRDASFSHLALAFAGGFFGILPDGITFLYLVSKKRLFARFTRIHIFFHTLIIPENEHPPAWLGILTQSAVVALSLLALLLPR